MIHDYKFNLLWSRTLIFFAVMCSVIVRVLCLLYPYLIWKYQICYNKSTQNVTMGLRTGTNISWTWTKSPEQSILINSICNPMSKYLHWNRNESTNSFNIIYIQAQQAKHEIHQANTENGRYPQLCAFNRTSTADLWRGHWYWWRQPSSVPDICHMCIVLGVFAHSVWVYIRNSYLQPVSSNAFFCVLCLIFTVSPELIGFPLYDLFWAETGSVSECCRMLFPCLHIHTRTSRTHPIYCYMYEIFPAIF